MVVHRTVQRRRHRVLASLALAIVGIVGGLIPAATRTSASEPVAPHLKESGPPSIADGETNEPIVLGAPTVGSAIWPSWYPYAEALPEFGGVWVDREDGRDVGLTLFLTDRSHEPELRARFPKGWDLQIETVAHPLRELQAAASEVVRTWPIDAPDAGVVSAAPDVRHNDVEVTARTPQAAPAPTGRSDATSPAPVRIRVEPGPPLVGGACTDRDHCTSPMRPGVRVSAAGAGCTMSWYSQYTHFLTSGHCNQPGTAMWSHAGWGNVGTEALTAIHDGQPNQVDAMRVVMPVGQRSNVPYAQTATIVSRRHPLGGELACASLGTSDINLCGTVTQATITYSLSNFSCGGCTFLGTKVSIPAVAGDSGSPLYSTDFWQLGVLSTLGSDSLYARILDAANALGSPFGNFESAQRVAGGIRVKGWAIDPDTTSAITVRVYIDVTPFDRTANLSRPDVGAAYPYGNNHGFDTTIPVGSGPNTVCVWAVNQSYGGSTLLNCANVP